MLIEERKRAISMHPITLLVCFVCLVGLSVSATYLIVRAGYQSQLNNQNQQVLDIRKDLETMAHEHLELRDSLKKSVDKYSKLQTRYKDLESKLEATEQKNAQAASKLAPNSEETLVLKPTWVSSGETTLAFDGNLRIVLHQVSREDECREGSAAVGYLTGETEKNKLCLRTGEPEGFTYQGKNYSFNLSGIAAKENAYRYCISISLDKFHSNHIE